MRIRGTFAAALLAGTMMTSGALATTYHVGPRDNIQGIIAQANAGDTIIFGSGTYSAFSINRSGLPGRPITIRSASPGGAHIVATGNNQPAIGAYGQSNITISGFRLTSERGDGMKVGGTSSGNGTVSNIQITGNTVQSAWLDGLKVFHATGVSMTNNIVRMAGSSGAAGSGGNPNGDGGLDWVSVSNSRMSGNHVLRTNGWACAMVKNGSNNNTITGNTFSGCEVNGLDMAAPSSGRAAASNRTGTVASNNTVQGNRISSGSGCTIKLHETNRNNNISGNTVSGRNCGVSGNNTTGNTTGSSDNSSNAGAQSTVDSTGQWLTSTVRGLSGMGLTADQIDAQLSQYGIRLGSTNIMALLQGNLAGIDYGTLLANADLSGLRNYLSGLGIFDNDFIDGIRASANEFIAKTLGVECLGGTSGVIAAGVSAISSIFGGGRATAVGQAIQHAALIAGNRCASDQLEELEKMNEGVDGNPAEDAPEIIWESSAPSKSYSAEAMGEKYIVTSKRDMTPDDSRAAMEAIREQSDNSAVTAAREVVRSAEQRQRLANIANQSMAIITSSAGPKAALQGLAQIAITQMAHDAARAASEDAFRIRQLEAMEEQRAGERMAKQRRDRLYHRLSAQASSPGAPFRMFQ